MNPQYPQSVGLVRALRGPIMLITLGTLMALHRFGDYNIGKTWPILLIVLGAMKLLERATQGPSAYAGAPRPGGF